MNVIKSYFKAKIRINRFKKSLRISNARDFSFPYLKKEIKYICPNTNKRHNENISIFKISNLILNNSTGWLFFSPPEKFHRPVCIKESSFDDHQELSMSSSKYNADKIYKNLINKRFLKPVIIFNITRKKRNYYHFLAEDAAHLVWQLKTIKEPVDILIERNQPKFIIEFLDLLSNYFKLKVIYLNPDENLRILSPVYVTEDTLKRNFGNYDDNIIFQKKKLEKEVNFFFKEKLNTINIISNRDQNISPRSWGIQTENEIKNVKNNTLNILPSISTIDALKRFSNSLIKNLNINHKNKKVLLISREEDSTRGRKIKQEKDLMSAVPNLKKVSFGKMNLIQQIKICKGSNVLIGMHGAGLTNMIFLKENSLIIELVPTLKSLPTSDIFSSLAKICGHNYRFFYSTTLGKDGYTSLSDITIKEISKMVNNTKSLFNK